MTMPEMTPNAATTNEAPKKVRNNTAKAVRVAAQARCKELMAPSLDMFWDKMQEILSILPEGSTLVPHEYDVSGYAMIIASLNDVAIVSGVGPSHSDALSALCGEVYARYGGAKNEFPMLALGLTSAAELKDLAEKMQDVHASTYLEEQNTEKTVPMGFKPMYRMCLRVQRNSDITLDGEWANSRTTAMLAFIHVLNKALGL